MLPDADDFPSPAPELAGDTAVAGHVGLEFADPEGAVAFRTRVTLGAVVLAASAASRRSVKCQDVTSHPYRLSSLLTKACQAEIGSPIPAAPRPAHAF